MIVYNNFEWDVREASACRVRHGVSFKEATTVLEGENVTITEDPASGQCRAVGPTSRGQVLVVVYKRGTRVRILDAAPPGAAKKAPAVEAPAPEAPADPVSTATPRGQRPDAARGEPASEQAPSPAPPAEAQTAAHRKRRQSTSRSAAPPPSVAPERAESPISKGESPASREAVSAPPTSDSPPAGAGWDAATYGIYWNVYSAARKEAREQGKSQREAQRLGKEAGEQAVRDSQGAAPAPTSLDEPATGPASESAPKSSRRTNSWRAAARAVKPDG